MVELAEDCENRLQVGSPKKNSDWDLCNSCQRSRDECPSIIMTDTSSDVWVGFYYFDPGAGSKFW